MPELPLAPALDDSDLAMAGRLPDDPEADCLPVEVEKSPEQEIKELATPLAAWGEDGWLLEKPSPRPMLLTRGADSFLPMGKIGLLAAAGGAGKTQVLTQLAVAVASAGYVKGERLQWLDTFTVEQGGNVLLALGEEDREEVKRRLQRAARGLNITPEQTDRTMAHLFPMPLYGRDARLVNPELEPARFMLGLEAFLASQEWALIIMDPGSRFMGADDEKDNAAATKFIEMLERLTKAPGGPAILIALHTGKQGTRDGLEEDDQYLARGSSAFVDGARWAASLRWNNKAPKDHRPRSLRFIHTKSNYTPKAPPLDLTMGDDGFITASTPEELEALEAAINAGNSKPSTATKSKPKTQEQSDVF